jgi:hypothetical protein
MKYRQTASSRTGNLNFRTRGRSGTLSQQTGKLVRGNPCSYMDIVSTVQTDPTLCGTKCKFCNCIIEVLVFHCVRRRSLYNGFQSYKAQSLSSKAPL